LKKTHHIIFSILLLLSFSWQCAAKTIIYFNFKANQKELAETVCENKNKPKSCCEAKCFLDKEIKKEEKRESDFPNALKDKVEKTELMSFPYRLYDVKGEFVQTIDFKYIQCIGFNINPSIFHPPSV